MRVPVGALAGRDVDGANTHIIVGVVQPDGSGALEHGGEIAEQQRLVFVHDNGGGGMQGLDVHASGQNPCRSDDVLNAIGEVDELGRTVGGDLQRRMSAGGWLECVHAARMAIADREVLMSA